MAILLNRSWLERHNRAVTFANHHIRFGRFNRREASALNRRVTIFNVYSGVILSKSCNTSSHRVSRLRIKLLHGEAHDSAYD